MPRIQPKRPLGAEPIVIGWWLTAIVVACGVWAVMIMLTRWVVLALASGEGCW